MLTHYSLVVYMLRRTVDGSQQTFQYDAVSLDARPSRNLLRLVRGIHIVR
jgi:hypothetical protein